MFGFSLPSPVFARAGRAALALLVTFLGAGCFRTTGESQLEKAERLLQDKKYDEAITAYRGHIERRLATTNRPEWENPHFYLLLIGDVYLGQGDVADALASYEDAAKHQIHSTLISDRYRSAARFYEESGKLQEALDLLRKHRELDTLLFDAMLDRIAKRLTEIENEKLRQEEVPTETAP